MSLYCGWCSEAGLDLIFGNTFPNQERFWKNSLRNVNMCMLSENNLSQGGFPSPIMLWRILTFY